MRILSNMKYIMWCLNILRLVTFKFIFKFSLPATTRLVPTKLSKIVAYFGPFSLNVFDAKRHKSVAMPSINAPANGDTWNEITARKKKLWKQKKVRKIYESRMGYWTVLRDILASQQNSPQMHDHGVFVPIQATRKIVQISIHSSRPLIVPMFWERHHVVSHFLQSSPPCECMGMLRHCPILATTKRWEGRGQWHKLRCQSCQRLKK